MSRRFQFSVRGVLGLMAAFGVALGLWHHWEHAANVDCTAAAVQNRISATGQFTRLSGAETESCWIEVSLQKRGAWSYWKFDNCLATRRWWGVYYFQSMIGPFHEPGNYKFQLFTADGPRFAGRFVID